MPKVRSRSRARFRRNAVLIAVAVSAVVIVGALLVTIAQQWRTRSDPALARRELAMSLGLFDKGNYNAAREHAQNAVRADDNWGLAHAVLARAFLALGDGPAAEGELGRATASGFDPARAHQLYAEAYLFEGDPDRAITEAKRAAPRYGGYATRVIGRALAAKGNMAGAQDMIGRVLDANPNDSLAWSDLGRVRYDAGNLAGAIEASARAVQLDPNNLAALTLRGELVRAQYGLVAAMPWFENALSHDAYYHPALIEYAATLGDAGRYTDMLAMTRRALAVRPGSAQALYLQAVMAARDGKDDLARAMLQHAGGALDDLPGAQLLSGMLAYRAGGYEQAIGLWRNLLGQQPYNVQVRQLLGAALLRSGDANGALDMLKPIALRDDADSYTLTLAARAFERTGQRDWMAKFLDRRGLAGSADSAPFGSDDDLPVLADAVHNAPGDPAVAVDYVRGLIENGRDGEGLAVAQRLVTASPGAPDAWLLVGDAQEHLRHYFDAVTAYRRAANLRFDEPTMLRLSDALGRTGDRNGASHVVALYLSQNPQSISAQRIAAQWQIASGDFDTAIDTLEGLRDQIGDRDAALLAQLSTAYLGADDPDTARVYAAAAYRLAPGNPLVSDAYGQALYGGDRTAQAAQLFEKATQLAPNVAAFRWHLGQAYAALGRKGDARGAIEAAMADPGFAERAAAGQLLKTLA
jgi:tetratricopeptide (TPR) repeat protein